MSQRMTFPGTRQFTDFRPNCETDRKFIDEARTPAWLQDETKTLQDSKDPSNLKNVQPFMQCSTDDSYGQFIDTSGVSSRSSGGFQPRR